MRILDWRMRKAWSVHASHGALVGGVVNDTHIALSLLFEALLLCRYNEEVSIELTDHHR